MLRIKEVQIKIKEKSKDYEKLRFFALLKYKKKKFKLRKGTTKKSLKIDFPHFLKKLEVQTKIMKWFHVYLETKILSLLKYSNVP